MKGFTPEFKPFPKIGRWSNNKVAITEKIDGTNGSLAIEKIGTPTGDDVHGLIEVCQLDPTVQGMTIAGDMTHCFILRAGSRNRWLTLASDNYGFCQWVHANALKLLALGEGTHYGEWWGNGIQRGYGLEGGDKRFSLFNVGRWINTPNGIYDRGDTNPDKKPIVVDRLSVVPTLYYGPHRDAAGNCAIEQEMRRLKFSGSAAAPGFKDPEGVMVYFETLKTYSKAPFDPLPKGQG